MAILVDTGVLLGAIDADDNDHTAAAGVLGRYIGELLVPVTVVAETAWQLERNVGPGTEADFLDSIVSGELIAVDLTPADYERAAQLIRQYSTLHLGLVDASLIAIAERMDITTIATLDKRHFTVVRPAHCSAFELIP